jgi:ectoine hydroxylase-related dioxygenase (phytanoyl-CoA dioxygenase family)
MDGHKAAGLDEVPDINANRAQWDIVYWDLDVGDVAVHDARTLHFAGPNRSQSISRRALVNRYTGDDIRWNPSHHDQVLDKYPLQPNLQIGSRITCDLFPRVWPSFSTS